MHRKAYASNIPDILPYLSIYSLYEIYFLLERRNHGQQSNAFGLKGHLGAGIGSRTGGQVQRRG